MSGERRPLPLAAASIRLRGKPGRPRKSRPASPPAPLLPPATGHSPGTAASQHHISQGGNSSPLAHAASALPRLFDVNQAALYLGLSPWTVRDLVAAGRLARVRLPLGGAGELRRVLVDVRDLDRLIEMSKENRG